MQKQLTDEQKDKLKKLQWSTTKKIAWKATKSVFLIVLSNFIVLLVNALYVDNTSFVIMGSMVSVIMIFASLQRSLDVEHGRVKEEIKKILEP